MIYLVRYSEIFLKSEYVRREWERKLVENIKKVANVKVKRKRGRIFVYSDEKIEEKLKKIFGIVSFSPVLHCKLSELNKKVLEFCREKIGDAKTFAVRVKRVGDHDFTSQQKAAEIGSMILREFGLKVDLENPDFTIYVEIRNDDCYIFSDVIKGPGGLPLGVEGNVVSLFSGGIDSPVATYMVMKRGCKVFPIHFDLGSLGYNTLNKARKVIGILKDYDPELSLKVVDHETFLNTVVKILKKEKKLEYTCLLCKRRMYKIAEKYCSEVGGLGIVTGEAIGQVASQTLHNLFVITKTCSVPVYRPLIGMDKVEIERIAREIGTFEISSMESKCYVAPKKPKTKGSLRIVEELERKVYGDLDDSCFNIS